MSVPSYMQDGWLYQEPENWESYLPQQDDYETQAEWAGALAERAKDTSPPLGKYWDPIGQVYRGGRQTEQEYALRKLNNFKMGSDYASMRLGNLAANYPDMVRRAYDASDEYGNPLLDPAMLAFIEKALNIPANERPAASPNPDIPAAPGAPPSNGMQDADGRSIMWTPGENGAFVDQVSGWVATRAENGEWVYQATSQLDPWFGTPMTQQQYDQSILGITPTPGNLPVGGAPSAVRPPGWNRPGPGTGGPGAVPGSIPPLERPPGWYTGNPNQPGPNAPSTPPAAQLPPGIPTPSQQQPFQQETAFGELPQRATFTQDPRYPDFMLQRGRNRKWGPRPNQLGGY